MLTSPRAATTVLMPASVKTLTRALELDIPKWGSTQLLTFVCTSAYVPTTLKDLLHAIETKYFWGEHYIIVFRVLF